MTPKRTGTLTCLTVVAWAAIAGAQPVPAVPAAPAVPAVPAMPAVAVIPDVWPEVSAALAAADAALQSLDGARVLLPDLTELRAQQLLARDRQRADLDSQRALVQADRERQRDLATVEHDRARAGSDRQREGALYDQAQQFMDSGRWDRAVETFGQVAGLKGTRADGALYWKAYSQDRAGQRNDALATLAELTKAYPSSRYLKQAQALDLEVRRNLGQPVRPEAEGDEELKLMAVNALLASDPAQALPIVEKLLQGPASPKLQERALFVLAQSDSPRARQILSGIAKGNGTPELQNKAIQYLGVQGGAESRAVLADVYASSTDIDVKRRILRAFMVGGDRERVLNAARSEQNAELRGEAVRQLGVMGAHDELWHLYQKETSVDVKKQILQAMFVGGNATRLIDLAKTEPNAELRRAAVRNLGVMGADKTGDALVAIYATEKDPEVRRAIVNGLMVQNNASALVALARKESDPEMKKAIVQRLSTMQNKVATDYMIEILNK